MTRIVSQASWRELGATGVAMCLLLEATSAEASLPDLVGFGARGRALAGAVTATVSGHESVYYNPAALALSQEPRFTGAFAVSSFSFDIADVDQDMATSTALELGFALPVPFRGPLERRVALGFGFVLPTQSVLVANVPRPGEPRMVRFQARAETVSLMGALGARLTDDFAVGAGFIALAELHGAIDVAPNETKKIGTTVRDELVADYAPIFGVLWVPSGVSFGLTFRGESAAQFDLPISANLGGSFPLPIPTLEVSGVAQYDPMELSLGSSVDLGTLMLCASVDWSFWSRYPTPIIYTAVPAGFPAQPEPGFSNTVSVRIGAEQHFAAGPLAMTARVGLALEPSPAPVTTAGYLDASIWALGAGLSGRWSALSLDLSLLGQWVPSTDRTLSAATAGLPTPSISGRSVSISGFVVTSLLELGVSL